MTVNFSAPTPASLTVHRERREVNKTDRPADVQGQQHRAAPTWAASRQRRPAATTASPTAPIFIDGTRHRRRRPGRTLSMAVVFYNSARASAPLHLQRQSSAPRACSAQIAQRHLQLQRGRQPRATPAPSASTTSTHEPRAASPASSPGSDQFCTYNGYFGGVKDVRARTTVDSLGASTVGARTFRGGTMRRTSKACGRCGGPRCGGPSCRSRRGRSRRPSTPATSSRRPMPRRPSVSPPRRGARQSRRSRSPKVILDLHLHGLQGRQARRGERCSSASARPTRTRSAPSTMRACSSRPSPCSSPAPTRSGAPRPGR